MNKDNAKCIYCGTSENINESHIIPDALIKNKTLTNKNVCTKKHNNDFNNLFESYITTADEFKRLTEFLGIASSKSNKPQKFPVTLRKGDIEIKNHKVRSMLDIFTDKGKNIIKHKYNVSLEASDIVGIWTNPISIHLDLFYSSQMYRLSAKVCYEWYCKKNNINDKLEEFNEIIDYIENGITQNKDIVSIVINHYFKYQYEEIFERASHTIGIYNSKDGNTYGLFSLFGIITYKVRLKQHNIITNINNTVEVINISSKGDINEYSINTGDGEFMSKYFKDPDNEINEVIANNYRNIFIKGK